MIVNLLCHIQVTLSNLKRLYFWSYCIHDILYPCVQFWLNWEFEMKSQDKQMKFQKNQLIRNMPRIYGPTSFDHIISIFMWSMLQCVIRDCLLYMNNSKTVRKNRMNLKIDRLISQQTIYSYRQIYSSQSFSTELNMEFTAITNFSRY